MKPRFINPYTDFGFKKLFGEEGSKHLLKDFLNQILPPIHTIKDLTLKKTEALPEIQSERSAVFDIYCESESGSKFIVEMQKAKMNYFKDRMVLYSSFPIKEQAEKGEWDYKLQPVYCIAILDFVFETVELDMYEMSLKRYRDLKGVIDTSFHEGLEKGEQIGLEKGEQIGLEKGEQIGQRKKEEQAIKNALQKGKLSPEEIADMLEVSLERVLQIKE